MSAAPLFYAIEESGLLQSTVKNTRCLLNMAKNIDDSCAWLAALVKHTIMQSV